MGPKCFSAVMVTKTTAHSERHNKSNAPVVLQLRGIFQVVDWKTGRLIGMLTLVVVRNQKYFKFVISASHCEQLGLYSQCYTVCDFTLR